MGDRGMGMETRHSIALLPSRLLARRKSTWLLLLHPGLPTLLARRERRDLRGGSVCYGNIPCAGARLSFPAWQQLERREISGIVVDWLH